jgi:hypothetical protein
MQNNTGFLYNQTDITIMHNIIIYYIWIVLKHSYLSLSQKILFMKKTILFLSLVLTIANLFAQASCEEVKKENEYLKKALNITNPIKTASGPKADFNLLKCEGDSKQQKLTLVFTVINHDANKYFSIDKANAVDVEANQYKTNSIQIGSASIINTVYTETPVKTTIIFSEILPSVKMLKIVNIPYACGNEVNLAIEFRDIPIIWK